MNNSDENRPDPDEILAAIKREEELNKRGKLKIFFAMCAGIGKTYSMLRIALADKAKGIDVDIGYVEPHSRSDTVSQTTGVVIRETLPDEIFENADDIELVDITPDELLERFADGKIYTPERSKEAVQNFFRKGNITALREMSLRIVADRVDKQLRNYMQKKRISGPWKSGMHPLAVIGPSPHSAKLIRWTKNLSYTMGASLTALYVETTKPLNADQKQQLSKNLGLARQLGAEIITTSGIMQYILVSVIIILCSAICFHFTEYLGYQSVSFILLFVVSILATLMGIGPILLASSLSAFVWNFFFIPPRFTLHIEKTEDALMFVMFFIIALVNGVLTARVRRQERLTRDREERTNALYQFTKELANAGDMNDLIKITVKDIKKHFGLDVLFILQDGLNNLSEYSGPNAIKKLSYSEISVAEWVFSHSRKAGKYTDTLPSNKFTFYPLTGNSIKPGVMAVKHSGPLQGEMDEFWGTFLTQISNAVESEFLNDIARKARFLDESDKLYKTLFNSISHELRIPVATIMGASDSLLSSQQSPEIRDELSHEIFKASQRLNRLIENLLSMSRLESGRITPRLDWCDIHDLINKVSENLHDELKPFNLHVVIPGDMPFVKIDFGLMEQVLHNLIYNATQYAPPSTNIRVKAFYDSGMMTLQVMDRGPGFPKKEISLVFNKFYRLEGSKAGGTGLGLSIARGFVEAHKGTIVVENRKNGGAEFTIKIPTEILNEDFK